MQAGDFVAEQTEMRKIFLQRNEKYGDSFDKLYNELGALSGACQMFHKMQRILTLSKAEQTEENLKSLLDSCEDLGNYATMTAIKIRQQLDKEILG